MINNFFPENYAEYVIMWKNILESLAPDDNIVWRKRFSCWISKARDTHLEYKMLTGFPRQQ